MITKHNAQLFVGMLVWVALLGSSSHAPQSSTRPTNVFTIDGTAEASAPRTDYLQMGSPEAGLSPSGHSISVNSQFLVLDGKPWLPVMGEMHFTRYPARYWEEEILKMKAGGVQVISTYVFWIHHEEVEGNFDWTGDRDLRSFVKLCAKHGMYVYPRIGPFAHGEVRNGGLPDWVVAKGATRVNDATYMKYVQRYYGEVGKQLSGLLWKDSGPVIGIQLENEYADRSPQGGAPHILKLKELAQESGLDLPLYTVTGWDNAVIPPHVVIPVFGGYPDEPWAGTRGEMEPDTQGIYQFHYAATNAPTGILQAANTTRVDAELFHYPRFTAELGGGMQITYHRRVVIGADDIPPIALTALGSGVNLIGYYMYQGGANPEGRLSTLQESQETDFPNDVPVKSYDFQSPLGEYGQVNPSYRKLAVIHQFVRDFGSDLAPMAAAAPDVLPKSQRDTTTLRVAARVRDNRAFIFFNNYIRHYPMPEQKAVQIALRLQSGTVLIPRDAIDIPSQTAFFWPVNLDLEGVTLRYATVQPLAKFQDGGAKYFFFSEIKGVKPQLAFNSDTFSSIKAPKSSVMREHDCTYVQSIFPSTDVAVELQTRTGETVRLIVLSTEQAENSYKASFAGREHFLMTTADFFTDGHSINLRSTTSNAFSLSVLPPLDHISRSSAPVVPGGSDGVFSRYTALKAREEVPVKITEIRAAKPSMPIPMGKPVEWRHGSVAKAPDDAAFDRAAEWQISLPANGMDGLSDVFLNISYVGDVGRLRNAETLIDDNFYNGQPWEVGLKRFGAASLSKGWTLQVLPLRQDAPIYLPQTAWPNFHGRQDFLIVNSITAQPQYEWEIDLTPSAIP